MKRFRNITLKFTTALLIVFFSNVALAGYPPIGSPCNDPFDPCCAPDGNYNPDFDPRCPIDGGVVALLAAGVGYGLKRVRDSRKGMKKSS